MYMSCHNYYAQTAAVEFPCIVLRLETCFGQKMLALLENPPKSWTVYWIIYHSDVYKAHVYRGSLNSSYFSIMMWREKSSSAQAWPWWKSYWLLCIAIQKSYCGLSWPHQRSAWPISYHSLSSSLVKVLFLSDLIFPQPKHISLLPLHLHSTMHCLLSLQQP